MIRLPGRSNGFRGSITTSGVAHRVLRENGRNDILLKYMEDALQKHHISSDALQRHIDLITSLRIKNLPIPRSPYPQNLTTQKGNIAEVFLAEYLSSTTDAQLPIYRLRYNTNPDQSMKGDDVLLFDLDAEPVRVIIGESRRIIENYRFNFFQSITLDYFAAIIAFSI